MDTATCFECSFSVLLPVINEFKWHSFQGISQDLCLPGLISSSVISSYFTLCFPQWNWLPCVSVYTFDHLFDVSLLIRLSLCLFIALPTAHGTQKILRCGGWMKALGTNLLPSDSLPGRRLSLTFAPHFCTLVPHMPNGWTPPPCFTCLPVSIIHQRSGGSTQDLLQGGVLRWQRNHYETNIHQRPVSHLCALWGLFRWCLSCGFQDPQFDIEQVAHRKPWRR